MPFYGNVHVARKSSRSKLDSWEALDSRDSHWLRCDRRLEAFGYDRLFIGRVVTLGDNFPNEPVIRSPVIHRLGRVVTCGDDFPKWDL
jgi:hypothetical protein